MVMVFKYQLVSCNSPLDLLEITINHFDSVMNIRQNDQVKQLVQTAKFTFINHYKNHINCWQMQMIRYDILTFVQDIKTKVSIFFRDGIQENNGNFVIKSQGVVSCQCQVPGEIRYFNDEKEISFVEKFISGCNYVFSDEKTTLGMNM